MKGLNYDADNTLSKVDIEELGLDLAPDGEVSEEVGLSNIKILAQSKHINKYDWPKEKAEEKKRRGQKQRFFIAKIENEQQIKLDFHELSKYYFFEKNEIAQKAGYKNLKDSIEIIQKEFPELLT